MPLAQAPPVSELIEKQVVSSSATVIARQPFKLAAYPFPHAVCTLGGDVLAVSSKLAVGTLSSLLH